MTNPELTDLKPCNKDKQNNFSLTFLASHLVKTTEMKNPDSLVIIISLLLSPSAGRKEPQKTTRTVTETGDDTIEVIVENTQVTDR